MDVVDFKEAYTWRAHERTPPPSLYRLVVEALPDALIEDPDLTGEKGEILEPHRDRITWDAPIHSVADVDALAFPPNVLNSKPSRFGSVKRLFEFYDTCAERGIALYGGGQFELGPGPWPHPVPRLALPPGCAERRCAERVQPGAGAGRACHGARCRRARTPSGFGGCGPSRTGVA